MHSLQWECFLNLWCFYVSSTGRCRLHQEGIRQKAQPNLVRPSFFARCHFWLQYGLNLFLTTFDYCFGTGTWLLDETLEVMWHMRQSTLFISILAKLQFFCSRVGKPWTGTVTKLVIRASLIQRENEIDDYWTSSILNSCSGGARNDKIWFQRPL